MTVFIRRKQGSNQLLKRRSTASKTTIARKCSSLLKTKSLVPKKVTRRMVEVAVALDTQKFIGMFSERKRWKSLTDLTAKSDDERDDKERLARLVVKNEKLIKDLETVTLKLRDVERQLIYERAFYEEQKYQFIKVMKSRVLSRNVKTQTFEVDFVYESEKVCSLISELRTLREMYSKQKTTISEVCEKYLRMRTFKEYLLQLMVKAEERHKMIMEETLDRFDKERIAFATIEREGKLSQDLQCKLIQRSSKLAYNNAALQMQLHSIMSSKVRACPKSLSSDLFIYSALKEMRDLSETERHIWMMMDNRRVLVPELDSDDETVGKFISYPVEDEGSMGYKITPLFRIEDVDEVPELDDDDIEEVEIVIDELTGKSESATEIKKPTAVPPRSDSAPNITRTRF
ncbi:uncharacterized protein [Halyomorpha halys]|uniref:uncharacterized protein n=1 Tax=Halyomorpha halys TaxID=286706 RepID=UPI000D0C965E|nr:uncharacterized protein LOC112210512 [Halyomorpha halys]